MQLVDRMVSVLVSENKCALFERAGVSQIVAEGPIAYVGVQRNPWPP